MYIYKHNVQVKVKKRLGNNRGQLQYKTDDVYNM